MAAPELRPYQREAIDAVIAARQRGVRRMVVCLPTGAGKTVIFAELIRRARHDVLVLAHRDELVQQAREKIARALRDGGDTRRTVAIEQGDARAGRDAAVIVASGGYIFHRERRLARAVEAFQARHQRSVKSGQADNSDRTHGHCQALRPSYIGGLPNRPFNEPISDKCKNDRGSNHR